MSIIKAKSASVQSLRTTSCGSGYTAAVIRLWAAVFVGAALDKVGVSVPKGLLSPAGEMLSVLALEPQGLLLKMRFFGHLKNAGVCVKQLFLAASR
ncbi:MAG: hypothetical protein HQ446_04800 [Polaromonas sp.]|nr:hypothetical protein [Polaromonas sp.]